VIKKASHDVGIFQIASTLLITAWHVPSSIGLAGIGANAAIDPLGAWSGLSRYINCGSRAGSGFTRLFSGHHQDGEQG
jgi:hypothetical protein